MRNGLASVAWLAERLGQPNLRVVDATWFLPNSPFASPVAARAAHAAARVPGSTFWDLDEVSDAAAAPSTPHNLPTPAQFAAEARRHGIEPDTRFYFVHSYHVVPDNSAVIAGTFDYGLTGCAALAQENLFATQFHPEKSHSAGLTLLKNFLDWDGRCS